MKATIFGAKEEHGDDNITNINMQQNNKGEEVKVLCVCVCVCVWFCFVLGPFLYIFVKTRKFFITKNLVIIYKLSTIKGFCH